ncbi:MAG: tetratricopeptide repeat protein [Verrucomicrobiota bacterium]
MNNRLQPLSFSLCALFGALMLPLVFSPPPAAAQQTNLHPAELYLQGYMLMREGAEFEQKSQFTGAFQKYAAANEIFDTIARSYPDWNPHMVSYRRKSLRNNIDQVQRRAQSEQGIMLENSQNPALPRTQSPSRPQSPPRSSQPLIVQSPPVQPQNTHPLPLPHYESPPGYSTQSLPQQSASPNVVARIPSSPNSSSPPVNPGDYSINSATNHIENKFRELRLRIDEIGSERDNLSNELRLKEARLQNTQAQLYESQQRELALQQEVTQGQRQYAGASSSPANSEQASILEAQLSVAKANLEAASRKTAELAAALNQSEKEVALLKEERGQLIAERNQMATIIGKIQTGGSVDIQRMVALNDNLRRQLDIAQTSAGQIAQDNAEVQQLRHQVATISQDLEIARAENKTYRSQITSLTDRLQDVSTQLASAAEAGISDPRAREENQMLRDIILRQLRQQARRQQAKELVMAELAKLEDTSATLLTQIEELTGAEVALNDTELAILGSNPAASSPDPDSPDLHGTLVSSRAPEENPSAARTNIAGKIKAASNAFEQGDFINAETLYQQIVDLDEKNPYYLCNLGIIKTHLKKYPEARQCLDQALTFDPFHAKSLLASGTLHFQQQDFDAALTAFNRAVEVNPNSAHAHQYLGLIANHKGWRDRAEQEFLRAIEIDPTFAEAHFNLSVLYISGDNPSKAKAEKHYTEALSHGAKRDAAMEQHIGG